MEDGKSFFHIFISTMYAHRFVSYDGLQISFFTMIKASRNAAQIMQSLTVIVELIVQFCNVRKLNEVNHLKS